MKFLLNQNTLNTYCTADLLPTFSLVYFKQQNYQLSSIFQETPSLKLKILPFQK